MCFQNFLGGESMKIDDMLIEPIKKEKMSVAAGTSTASNFASKLHKIYTTLYEKSMTPEEFYEQVEQL